MGKISPVVAKYIIHAQISIEGVVDKPDVIGAIFGQTEGLLGSEESILLSRLDRTVRVNQDGELRKVHLTRIEFNLLKYLMMHVGRAVPYDEIFREVFGYAQLDEGLQDTIRYHVNNLRRKIGDNSSNPKYIQTIRGVGYKFIGKGKPTEDDFHLGSKESIILYPLRREVYVAHEGELRAVDLTRTEFNLLEYLMMHAARVVLNGKIPKKVFSACDKNPHRKSLCRR